MSKQFEKIINLNKEFQEVILLEIENNYSLIQNFSVEYDKEVKKLPYRFNVFNQLKTNENAHSNLLQQLFLYQKEGNFDALKSFLAFINKEDNTFYFDCTQVMNPEITVERHRIDLLITEKNKYAIIVENKIHYAIDQENQIERYIEKCKNLGFSQEQIYVLYLTRYGGKPAKYSFNKSEEALVKAKKYLSISFHNHIYKWLKQYGQEVEDNEIVFKSAITQYIDHLEFLLQIPNTYQKMNTQLNKFLKSKLELDGKPAIESLSVIDEKIDEISKLQLQLQNLKEENTRSFFREWEEKIKTDFKDFAIVKSFEKERSYPNIGVLFNYKGQNFSVLIEREKESGRVYYGFGRHYASENLKEEIREFLRPLTEKEQLELSSWWYGYKYSSYEAIYGEFKHLLEKTLEKLK